MLKLLKKSDPDRPDSKRLEIMLIDTETDCFLEIYYTPDDICFRVNNLKHITTCPSAKIEIPAFNDLYPVIYDFYKNAKDTFLGNNKDSEFEFALKRWGKDAEYQNQIPICKKFKHNYPELKNFYEDCTVTYCDTSFHENKNNTMPTYTCIKKMPAGMNRVGIR